MGIHERKLSRLLTDNSPAEVMELLRSFDVRRSRFEVIVDLMRVLYVMKGTAMITRTSAMANVSYVTAKEILATLVDNGMVAIVVRRELKRKFYELTPLGVETLGWALELMDRLTKKGWR